LTTAQEPVEVVVDYGFTERQARFLVLVMRHAAVCVKRQYAAFAGIANGGEKCNAFFEKLVRRGFAVAADCIHNRARLYHVHHKPLYHAIGEADSRYRRTVSARSVAERLMRLDAALMSPDLDWLTTRAEKLAHLQARTTPDAFKDALNGAGQEMPDFSKQLPGTFPIGIDPSGHVLLLYLATAPWTDDFRTFLVGHTALFRATCTWTLRLVFPGTLRRALPAYQTVVYEELESPLDANTIYDLRRYFFHRWRGTDVSALPESLRGFLNRCGEVFEGPRFTHLYRRWLTDEDTVLRPVAPEISEAFASGRAALECVVLPHIYQHLSPLVNRRRVRRRRLDAWDERGDETLHSINPSLNPVP
jgi:hypothetical protein